MKQERINFGVILRIALSLLPVLFGMTFPSMVLCSYHIVLSLLIFGPTTCVIGSLSTIGLSMVACGIFGAEGEIQGLYLGLQSVLCALGCIYAIIGRRGFFTGVWMAATGYFIPSYINIYTMAHSEGKSLAVFLTEMPVEMAKMQINMIAESANIDVSIINTAMEKLFELMTMIVPSILIVTSIAVGYIVMWVVCSPMRKPPFSESKIAIQHSFGEIKAPKPVSVLFILALVLMFLVKNETVVYVLANSAVILGSLCFFGGMSVVDFYMRRIIHGTVMRLIIHFLLYIFSAFMAGISPFINIFTVYVLLGIVASFVNIRAKKVREAEV